MAVKTIDRSKMKEYNIYAGLGGGFGGKKYQYTGLFESHEDAEHEAWEAACEEYDSYEGTNGLGTYADAIEEAHGELGWDRDDEDPELVEYANEVLIVTWKTGLSIVQFQQMKTRKQIRKTLFVTTL